MVLTRPVKVTAVTLAVLSAFGMLYAYYYRFDCRLSKERRIFEDDQITCGSFHKRITRDWDGQCYLTAYVEVTIRGEFAPVVNEEKRIFVWDPLRNGGEGDWKRIPRLPD